MRSSSFVHSGRAATLPRSGSSPAHCQAVHCSVDTDGGYAAWSRPFSLWRHGISPASAIFCT